MTVPDRLTEALPDWLGERRWFGGKGRPLRAVRVVAATRLRDGDPALDHLVVAVDYGADAERYQLLVGWRDELPQRLEHVAIGDPEVSPVPYDALYDPELTELLLAHIDAGRDVGDLSFHGTGAPLPLGTGSRVVGGEQSNSSVVYGEAAILKIFRKLSPGLNPDLEITRALGEAGCEHIVAPLGWIDGPLDGTATTLGLLQPFLHTATDGWVLAETSVRDLYAEGDLHADEVGGDFASESLRLGTATAQVHGMLAQVLGSRPATEIELGEMARRMLGRLEEAVGAVPELAEHAAALRAAFERVAGIAEPVALQRVHGDFHLGQVLRTEAGWVLLDFEGEPARPLAERRAPDSPLRDVAGMLRSFDYASRHLLAEQPNRGMLEYRATEWASRNRDAFCDGYADAAGTDPREQSVLLRALELEKAVYEVVYEARNRPSWLPIPLGSINRLVSA